jgi:hypothetical protein
MEGRPNDQVGFRRTFATVICVYAVLFLLPSDASAQAPANRIDICNKGNTTISVARVVDVKGLLSARGELFNIQHGKGWWRIELGKCERVFFERESDSRLAWFAFAYTDEHGTFGLANVRPTRGAGWRSSNQEFCARFDEGYSYKVATRAEATRCPGVNEPRDPSGYVRIPFTLEFYPDRVPDEVLGDFVAYTFNVSLDATTPVWFPLSNDHRNSAAPDPPPSAAPPPLPVPKPFQPGTVTATLLGHTIARWRHEGDGQWFYEDGVAVQAIKDAPYTNLGLFDWPAVFDVLPEAVDGFVWALAYADDAPRKFRVGRDGRLHGSSSDGSVWTTTSLQSLDVTRAKYTVGVVSVPCRDGYQYCVWDKVSGLKDRLSIYVGLNNYSASERVLEGLRGLKKMFGEPTRVVREDGNCACLRYDVAASPSTPVSATSSPVSDPVEEVAAQVATAATEGPDQSGGGTGGGHGGSIVAILTTIGVLGITLWIKRRRASVVPQTPASE